MDHVIVELIFWYLMIVGGQTFIEILISSTWNTISDVRVKSGKHGFVVLIAPGYFIMQIPILLMIVLCIFSKRLRTLMEKVMKS